MISVHGISDYGQYKDLDIQELIELAHTRVHKLQASWHAVPSCCYMCQLLIIVTHQTLSKQVIHFVMQKGLPLLY